ncbi:MAG TPA: hypothetical protein VKZ54_02390, partial [Membranihabitans sp.]|nr:hypothetical protein [Membranihabitans sp.]
NFTSRLNDQFDALFLCMGHGRSGQFLKDHPIPEGKIIIDLSNEFRFSDPTHDYIYGLPEWQRDKIKNSRRIANPGCFATGIQLALLPLAKAGLLNGDITATSITGSTGAGLRPGPTTHFSWRNNNLSIYKLGTHQHIPEVYQSARDLQPGFEEEIYMVPVRGDFPRGIFSSILTSCELTEQELDDLYREYYTPHPFTIVTQQEVDLKRVVNTNRAYLRVEKLKNKVHITSTLDNLLKGASGQAVQNLNLIAGWDETTGLLLKPTVY